MIMRAIKIAELTLLIGGLTLSGAVSASEQKSDASAASGDASAKCNVQIDATKAAGSYNVIREQLDNGNCVCHVSTGPRNQSPAIEGYISELERTRECRGGVPVAAVGGGKAGRSFFQVFALPFLGVGGAAATGVALSSNGTPTSP